MIKKVKSESIGRWPGIFQRLGIEVGDGRHCPCPICGGKDRYRFDDKGTGSWICNQCGAGDGFALLQKVLKVDFKESIRIVGDIVGTVEPTKYQVEKKVTPEYLRKIFLNSKPTKQNDPVHKYLKNRGLSTIPKNIRTSFKCWEPETKQYQIAMLAIFQLQDGKAITMHRTYLDSDGYKLKIDSPKKILPGLDDMAGGAVRLFDPVDGVVGITEGIETAIAVFDMLKVPTWAALSANLVEKWEPIKGLKSVIIYADNDKSFTGQKAAYTLANRLYLNDIGVEVEVPEICGDYLDLMQSFPRPNTS